MRSVRDDLLPFRQAWPLNLGRRVLIDPFAFFAKLEKLPEDLNFLQPRGRRPPSLDDVWIERLDSKFRQKPETATLAVNPEHAQHPLVLALRVGRFVGLVVFKNSDCLSDRFAGWL
ncbi:MAG: hypothetical protein ACJ74Z_15070 [Bryobacteraceae bacterium]